MVQVQIWWTRRPYSPAYYSITKNNLSTVYKIPCVANCCIYLLKRRPFYFWNWTVITKWCQIKNGSSNQLELRAHHPLTLIRCEGTLWINTRFFWTQNWCSVWDRFIRELLTKFTTLRNLMYYRVNVIPRQVEVAQGVPGRLRPRIFLTFGTTRVVGRQPYTPAAFTPGEIPGTHFQRLSRPQGTWLRRGGATEKIPSDTTGNRSRDCPTSSAVP